MVTALTILLCFLILCMCALAASFLSLTALRHHMTFRQLLFTALVLVTNLASISMLFQSIYGGQAIPALPFGLIGFTCLFSAAQFATAAFLGAVGRLRQKLA